MSAGQTFKFSSEILVTGPPKSQLKISNDSPQSTSLDTETDKAQLT
jgi:hypothetical protein